MLPSSQSIGLKSLGVLLRASSKSSSKLGQSLGLRLQVSGSRRLSTARVLTGPSVSNSKAQQSPGVRLNWQSVRLTSGGGGQHPRPYVDPKYSYAFGRSNESFVYSTVGQELARRLETNADDLVFISHAEDKQVTLSELSKDVNRVAKALIKEFNIKKGDFVGVFAYNCYRWIAIQLACARIGAILTPINPSYKASELAFVLKKGHIKCLFMPGPKSPQSELNDHMDVLQSEQVIALASANELKLRDVILMDDDEYNLDELKLKLDNCELHNWSSVSQNDGRLFESIAEAEEAGVNEEEACVCSLDSVTPDDLFAVYYTSGTTGNPKGACVTHFCVVNNVRFCQLRIRASRPKNWRATVCTSLPMFHIFAGVLNTLAPLINNTRIVYPSHKYDVAAYVDSVVRYQANLTSMTPTMLIDLLSHVEQNKHLAQEVGLKIIQSGGAALMPELVTRAFKVLPNLEEVRTGYGSTENGSIATLQSIYEACETRDHSVGPPLDLCEVRIVKPDSDELVPLGERGEIQTRGHNTMLGYLDEPQKTAEVLTPNRWYRTGDIGSMYPHGSVQINGRLKHMIIKGGENIYPEEVENIILELEFVEDVHVVGVPDLRFGEQVCAWIKLKQGYKAVDGNKSDNRSAEGDKESKLISRDAIIKFCRDNITYFKVPKYVLFVDDFPMTPTKKVQNHVMTKMSVEILNLQDQVASK